MSNFPLKNIDRFGQLLLSLLFANVSPTGLNVRDAALVDSLDVDLDQVSPGAAIHWLAMDLLDDHLMEDLVAHVHHLLHEFRSEIL